MPAKLTRHIEHRNGQKTVPATDPRRPDLARAIFEVLKKARTVEFPSDSNRLQNSQNHLPKRALR
jgi:hypothetical protein